MKLRHKQVKILYDSDTENLVDRINKELLAFNNPDDIIDIKCGVFRGSAMIIYWTD